MITITVNGEQRQLPQQIALSELLAELDINNRYCAVECNRELVPREQHDRTLLQDGDALEIVTLVGGG